jgi:hypothetical protein
MAGYSGTPLPQKLGVKPGLRVVAMNTPKSAMGVIAEIAAVSPVELKLAGSGSVDVLLLYCDRKFDLEKGFPKAAARLAPSGGLWVAWPKKSSGVETDLDENIVREYGLGQGLVDNKVCAIDQTWSGLRFVVRLKDRPAAGPKLVK